LPQRADHSAVAAMTNPAALNLEEPLAIDEAREASRAMARQRRAAEDTLQLMVERAAEAERRYRLALSEAFIRNTDGPVAVREAKARADCADRSYERDLAAGMVRVQTERLRGMEGERAQLRALVDWSSRLRLDERENYDGVTYGRRAAT
jgi:hypothetical protein